MIQNEDIFMISEKISKLPILSIAKGFFSEINRKQTKNQLFWLHQIFKRVLL